MTPDLKQRLVNLDGELIELVKPINVLKYLNCSDDVEEEFLEGWRAGRPSLREVEIRAPDWTDLTAALDDFVRRCDGDDALLQFLRRTAWSYAEAGRMLMAAGIAEVTERSIHLYGRPAASLANSSFKMNVDLAPVTLDQFVEAANRAEGNCFTKPS